ncbi:MAG TPA: hypothetical protein VNM66_04395, partial [Thermodesulfobacteriota bacterium]|nr:hypothetical protein [Thermodesulfobacteriota bacterium]
AAGAALVDVHALVESAAGEGLAVGDRRLTVAFLGGLFSLDGIHPTDTGYAVVANLFIEAVNRRFGAGILALDAAAVAREDPLVPPRVAPGVALGAIAGDVVEAVVQVLDPARRR